MTILTGTSLRKRLCVILDHALWGVYPETPASAEEKAQLDADHDVLDAAFRAVDAAETDSQARMEYLGTCIDLGGITPEQAIDALVAIRLGRRLEAVTAADGGGES